jgi:hypothetical protein
MEHAGVARGCPHKARHSRAHDSRRNMHLMFATSRATGDRDHRFEMTAARTQIGRRRVRFVRRNRTERRPGDPTRGARHEQEVIRAPLVFGLPAVPPGQQRPSVSSSHTRETPVLSEGGLSHITFLLGMTQRRSVEHARDRGWRLSGGGRKSACLMTNLSPGFPSPLTIASNRS